MEPGEEGDGWMEPGGGGGKGEVGIQWLVGRNGKGEKYNVSAHARGNLDHLH